MILSFHFSSIPHIIFGPGKLSELFEIILKFGKNVLFVIGERSLKSSGKWETVVKDKLGKCEVSWRYTRAEISWLERNRRVPAILDINNIQF
ncbi:unnamed protein product [marine sediment metagenome]|uniref:Alcohol dehydrogenase iron-type/glycerol dehydrogenase GldA domain-containing protein n=1 Tax=marine sediment metagenome TaxID=412755 RepID=X1GB61_9ZZZZ